MNTGESVPIRCWKIQNNNDINVGVNSSCIAVLNVAIEQVGDCAPSINEQASNCIDNEDLIWSQEKFDIWP